jgi:hypothetical protein
MSDSRADTELPDDEHLRNYIALRAALSGAARCEAFTRA